MEIETVIQNVKCDEKEAAVGENQKHNEEISQPTQRPA